MKIVTKLFLLFSLSVLISLSAGLFYANKTRDSSLFDSNVEALADWEDDLIETCDTYCNFKLGYICILQTYHGFEINCDNMVDWTY